MSTVFRTYTIYRNPIEYPGKFAVRGWTAKPGASVPDPEPLAVVDTLDEARDHIPPEANVRFSRDETDDPSIVETWM